MGDAPRLLTRLLEIHAERSTTLVALGGGVVGDLTGFAAAICQRGMPFVQVPTTLLAQVDSSVGGKTGVNHPLGKNLIGAFYQPRAVLIDTDCLATLPDRELAAGLAEVIKTAAIRDVPFFEWLETNLPRIKARDADALIHAVTESCRIKAEIVAADEREAGERALLNFGHTFGHAIEAGVGYGEWLHGEAVAAGMVLAAKLSERLGLIAGADVGRLRALLQRAGLPVDAPRLGGERYLDLMGRDKKVVAGLDPVRAASRHRRRLRRCRCRRGRRARGAGRLGAACRRCRRMHDAGCAPAVRRPRTRTAPAGAVPAFMLRDAGRGYVAGDRCGDALLRRA